MNIHILFAVPALRSHHLRDVPFVARSLIPLMQEQGTQRGGGRDLAGGQACRPSSASLAQYQMGPVVWRTAVQRAAMGEFGRVCRIRPYPRRDHTMPLLVEILL